MNQSKEPSNFDQLNLATYLGAGAKTNQIAMLDVIGSTNQATGWNLNLISNQSVVSNTCLPPDQPPNSDIFPYPEAWRIGIAFFEFFVKFSRSNQKSRKIFQIFRDIVTPMI